MGTGDVAVRCMGGMDGLQVTRRQHGLYRHILCPFFEPSLIPLREDKVHQDGTLDEAFWLRVHGMDAAVTASGGQD